MNFLLFSLGGSLASIFAFFLTRSLEIHGWSTNKKSLLTAGLLSAFMMNLVLFQTMFSEKSFYFQFSISTILSFIISFGFYLASKGYITIVLTRLLLLNSLLAVLITLSNLEIFEGIPEPSSSFTFNNLFLAYQIPSILIIFLLIYLFEKKILKIATKNKSMYIIYNSSIFVLGMSILFWPVNSFYIRFLTLPFALILGYIGFCFSTHMFAQHTKQNVSLSGELMK